MLTTFACRKLASALAVPAFAAILIGSASSMALAAAATVSVPMEVTYYRSPATPWNLQIDPVSNTINASHKDQPQVSFEIDYDNDADDGHYIGITPIIAGKRWEGRFYNGVAPFIYPQLDPATHLIDKLRVEMTDTVLRVRFEGGSYRIHKPAADNEPLFLEAALGFDAKTGKTVVDLYGLQYLLPTMDNTKITFTSEGKEVAREVTRESKPSIEYFEAVTRVDVKDGQFGDFYFTTFVQRLQMQVHNNPITDIFELDFDHTWKDRGQKAVLSRLYLPLPQTLPPSSK